MRFSNTLSVAIATIASSTSVAAYGAPGACSGVCNNAHDPSIIRRQSDGTYFRFSTGNKIAVHTAPAITGPWTYKCAMLPSGSSINLAGNQDLWAPDVNLVGNTYYVTYTVSSFGGQNSAIGLATSTSMDCGTFKDLGATGVSSKTGDNYNAIDSQIFQNGNSYVMNYGSFWADLFQVNMANPPLKSSGSNRPLAFDPAGTHAVEGGYMVKNGNYYYLFFSNGICCGLDTNRPAAGDEYKIKVCRSTTATGGFVDANGKSCQEGGGTIVLPSHDNVYAPGGQGVYNDPVNGWVLYYHYVNTNIGYADGQKQFGWNKISWVNGWPTV